MTAIPKAQRLAVFERDKGVCKKCGRDTGELQELLAQIIASDLEDSTKVKVEKAFKKRMKEMGFTKNHLWEAHHKDAQAHGGEHDLSNLETLCVPCHTKETAMQSGSDAKAVRAKNKAKKTPGPVKDAKRKNKAPNVKIPGVNAPVWSL